MPIVKNKQTGEMIVVDDNGSPIEGAQIVKHKQTGELIPVDASGSPIIGPGRGGGLQTPPQKPEAEDPNGFFRSAYNAGLKPLIDTGKALLDPANYNAAHAKLVVHGILNTMARFNADRPDIAMAAQNKDNPNHELPVAIQQVIDGNYKGALGTLTGTVAPFLVDEVGTGLTKTKTLIKNAPESVAAKVLPKAFPSSSDVLPADKAAQVNDMSPRSVGQSTGNPNAQMIEQTHGGKVAAQLADEQRVAQQNAISKIKEDFVPGGIPSNPNKVIQGKLADNYFNMEAQKNAKYSDFQTKHVEPNVLPVQKEIPNPNYVDPGPPPTNANDYLAWKQKQATNLPTIKQTDTISGPVFLTHTLPIAEDLKTKLDSFKNGPEYQALPAISRDRFNTISSTVNNLVQRTEANYNGKNVNLPVQAYDKVKQLRTDIGKTLGRISEFGLPDKMLSDIKKSLGDDLQESVSNYWGNGKQAAADLQDANNSHAAFKELFNKELKGKLFKGNSNLSKTGGNMVDPTDLVDGIGKSPDVARQFIEALGPVNEKLAKGTIFEKLAKESMNEATGQFSPDKMINALQDGEGYQKIYTAKERGDLINWLRQNRTMNPADLSSRSGITKAMMFHMALPVTGLLTGLATGHSMLGLEGGLAVEIGLGQFAKKVLLNPKYARIAAQLPYVPAGSAQAGLLQTQLLKGLAGTRIGVVLKNGYKVPASVDEDGKVNLRE